MDWKHAREVVLFNLLFWILVFAGVLFTVMVAQGQEVESAKIEAIIPQDVTAKTMLEAKPGAVLMRRQNIETVKVDETRLQSKVYASPQWDMTGKPLVQYDPDTGTVTAKSRYVRFIPDAETGKLPKEQVVSNTGVKEYYTVADSAVTGLSWTVETDATVEWNKDLQSLTFRGFDGVYMFDSPPPEAWDADKKPVGVTATYKEGVLSYAIIPGEYRYPLIVDPTVTMTTGGYDLLGTRSWNADFLTARNATSGNMAGGNTVSSKGTAGDNDITRLFFRFTIGANMVACQSCTLFICANGNYNLPTNFHFRSAFSARNAGQRAQHSKFNGWASSGGYGGTAIIDSAVVSTWTSGTWYPFLFNPAGRDSVVAASGDTLIVAMVQTSDFMGNAAGSLLKGIAVNTTTSITYLSYTGTVAEKTSSSARYPFKNDPVPIWNRDPVPIWKR